MKRKNGGTTPQLHKCNECQYISSIENSLEEYKKRETSLLAEIDEFKGEKVAVDKELRNIIMKSKKADTEKDTLMEIWTKVIICIFNT